MAQSEALERVIVMWKDTVPLHEEPTPHHWRSEFEALCAKFPLPDDLIEEPVDADGVPSLWVSAPGVSEDRVLLHFHSGGYVMGSAKGYRWQGAGCERITPPRGPRKVLCVVVVTTCACGNGEGCAPPATSPAKWAMSTISNAPTLSAISRNFLKSMMRG